MKFSKTPTPFVTLILIALAAIFQGCDDNAGKNKKDASIADAVEVGTNDDSGKGSDNAENNVIIFHNALNGFISAAQSPFENIDKMLTTSDEYIDRGNSKPFWSRVLSPTDGFKKIPTVKFAAPDTFNGANKEFFNTRITLVKESVDTLLKTFAALDIYYTAEDFKDDWHKKFLVTKPKIEALMEKIAAANDEMLEHIRPMSDEIERRNLAKTPIGPYVLNMRQMMDKAREQHKALMDPQLRDTRVGLGVSAQEKADMLAYAKPIADQVDALTKELDELANKYQAIDRTPIKDSPLNGRYDDFFKNYESAQPNLRRIVRELRERGYQNEQHTIDSYFSSLMKAHNAFVRSANRE